MSGFDAMPEMPGLELALEVELQFRALPRIADLPTGGARGVVLLDGGSFQGPQLKGTVIGASGNDFAFFRPDGVVSLDARYILKEDDGTQILLQNRGYIWGRSPEVMQRFSRIANGLSDETVSPAEYYFRTMTTFETPTGRHDWLTRHAFVGAGARLKDGNVVRYYKVM